MPRPDTVSLARAMASHMSGETDEAWDAARWEAAISELIALVAAETSAFRLGEVLRCDVDLDMPVAVIKATYERLIQLGATDVHTRQCYANYLLLHGPDWDDLANAIRIEIEPAARAAGLLDCEVLGHHPVFYFGPR